MEIKTCDVCGDEIYWSKEDYALCRGCWEDRVISKTIEKLSRNIVKKFNLDEKDISYLYSKLVSAVLKIDDKIKLGNAGDK